MFGGSQEVKTYKLVVCDLWRKYDWKQLDRLLVVQTGEGVNQAKVFKVRAVPQGLCGNLINALKLLTNQEEDGDGLIQNIVTNLCEGSRKGLREGLRKNHTSGQSWCPPCPRTLRLTQPR